ncbi:MAG TPA: DUF3576 domain-containing protein [Caulobacteraceae bacterium]|nr:DUF3576 domain-containing protein [Caulobacteraceae bacterium]
MKRKASVAVLALLALSLAGCLHRGDSGPAPYRTGGFHLFGLGRPKPGPVAAIGVNGYLWRASLDTLAFMPLASADPYGGVILTDWYVNPEKTDERFKCTVYILDTRLRADGLNVTVFKQVRDATGAWVDAPTSDQTAIDIENAILTRARQIRLSNNG